MLFPKSFERRILRMESWGDHRVHQIQLSWCFLGECPGVLGSKVEQAEGGSLEKEGRKGVLEDGGGASVEMGFCPSPRGAWLCTASWRSLLPGSRERPDESSSVCGNHITLSFMFISKSFLLLQDWMFLHLLFTLRLSMPGTSRQSITVYCKKEGQLPWCCSPDISVQSPTYI